MTHSRTSLVIKSAAEWFERNHWTDMFGVEDDCTTQCFVKCFEDLTSEDDATVWVYLINGEVTYTINTSIGTYSEMTMTDDDVDRVIKHLVSTDLNELFVAMTMIKHI